jgi:hypothetical protein
MIERSDEAMLDRRTTSYLRQGRTQNRGQSTWLCACVPIGSFPVWAGHAISGKPVCGPGACRASATGFCFYLPIPGGVRLYRVLHGSMDLEARLGPGD